VEGKGAADAVYNTALRVELCKLLGEEFAGAAADIYKCFDQTQRPLLYAILEKAGMPKGMLRAYRSFQETMEVRNTVAGGLGSEYVRKTSIPQGDPYSMMMTALLMRPWMEQMRKAAVAPRILADDLQIFAAGPRHLENMSYAFDLTHEHMEDMGANIAPTKSITFASNITTRKWLRNHKWRRLGRNVPLRRDMRDLGGHLNTAERRTYGTTLTDRMRKTAESVRALQKRRAPYKAKAELIRTKQLPKALYGCETAPVNESALKKLQTKILGLTRSARSGNSTPWHRRT
jgi:hypothetical protein